MPYSRKRRTKRRGSRSKTARGKFKWRWSHNRGLYKKTPTPKSPRRSKRRTLKKASPLTPDGFYNQYLNPSRYR